jgi:hypothetical protein
LERVSGPPDERDDPDFFADTLGFAAILYKECGRHRRRAGDAIQQGRHAE